MAAIAFDLDERDVVAIDDDDEHIETIGEAWVEPDDDTVIDTEPEATLAAMGVPLRYSPGLADHELDALVGDLTRELCRRGAAPRHRSALWRR